MVLLLAVGGGWKHQYGWLDARWNFDVGRYMLVQRRA